MIFQEFCLLASVPFIVSTQLVTYNAAVQVTILFSDTSEKTQDLLDVTPLLLIIKIAGSVKLNIFTRMSVHVPHIKNNNLLGELELSGIPTPLCQLRLITTICHQ